MARLQDAQQQAINNYLRFGDVSCKRSGTREQLAYHSDAKHALSLDGREQLLSHILEMETPELMNSSNSDGNQQGCQLSWSSDFQLLPLSSGHMNNTYSSRTAGEQQQQVVVARGFARGEVLGFVLGCMMPSSDAEQLLLSAATPEEALQMVRLSFRFELEGEEEQRQQQLQGGSSSSSSKSVTVVTAGFKNGNPLAQVLDYRQIGPNCEVLGAGTGSPNAALLPVSHNRTGKVYLAVVAVRDITAGTEVTFDRGTASYVGCMSAVLRSRMSNQQQQQQQGEKLQQQQQWKSTKTQTEQQQQQLAAEAAAEGNDLPVCPVPAGTDVPAGKLHKSLMSQLLAALATCRKLPAPNAHRNALDKLLQQAVTLAHEAVVLAAAAAPAVQQLSPREEHREQQQQGSGRLSPALQQQQLQQQQQLSPREAALVQQHVSGKVSAAVQQLLSGGLPAAKAEAAEEAAAVDHRDLIAAESCSLSGTSSTPSAPRTPTFGGFLEDATAAEAERQQRQQGAGASRTHGAAAATAFATAAGAAAAATAAAEEDESLFGIQLSGFGSAESFESLSAAAVRPSRWSQSLSAAVEVPEEWQQGEGEADGHDSPQQQQQQVSATRETSLLDYCTAEQQQGLGFDGQECGEVCAGSVQANIQPLVRQLISQHKYMQRLAANAIMNMAYDCAESRIAIAEAGAIPPLVAMLKISSRSCQAAASGALSNLCIENLNNQAAIAALGGIQLLTGLLSSKSGAVQRAAARALNNLAWDIDNRAVIAAAGGIPSLVRLLASSCTDVQEHAAAALMNMARDIIYGIPVAIAAAGGIPALVSLLRLNCTAEVQDSAAGALMNLAYSTPSNRAAIYTSGGIPALVALLDSSCMYVQRSAAGALKNCSRDSVENQAAIVAAGGIPPLVTLLKGHRDDARFEAGGALWNLVHNNAEHLAELAAAGGVPELAHLMADQAPQQQ